MLLGWVVSSKLTRVFLAYTTTSQDQVTSHSKDISWFPNTLYLMVIKAGHSQSQWRRSCTSKRQFEQIGSCDRSIWLSYCLREEWWADFRREKRPLFFLFLICFASRETLWCWYTKATSSCVVKASRVVSLITWLELNKETGRIVSVAMVVTSLAALSGRWLPGIAEWPGIHWMKMEDDMELMELRIDNVWG